MLAFSYYSLVEINSGVSPAKTRLELSTRPLSAKRLSANVRTTVVVRVHVVRELRGRHINVLVVVYAALLSALLRRTGLAVRKAFWSSPVILTCLSDLLSAQVVPVSTAVTAWLIASHCVTSLCWVLYPIHKTPP